MKYQVAIVGLLVVLAGFGYYAQNYMSVMEVVKEVPVEKEVQPEWATDQDAVEAAQAVMRKKDLQSQEADLKARRAALKAEYEASDAELASQLADVQKELGTY